MNRQRPAAAQQHLGPVHQPGVPLGLPPRPAGLAGHRRRWSCWPCRPGTSAASSAVEAFRAHRGRSRSPSCSPAVILAMFVGQRARRDRGDLPADEDRRRRGAVEHLRLATARSRSFQIGGGNNDQTPTQIISIPDLLSILATNHVERRGQGAQPAAGAVRRRSTARATTSPTSSSSTGRCGSWPTSPRWSSCSPCGACWLLHRKKLEHAKWFLRIAPWVVIAPVPHEHRRLDADRERPPALDRPGADEDGRRRSRRRCPPPTSGSASSVFVAHLRRPGRRRRLPHDPLRPAATWRRRPRRRGDVRRRRRRSSVRLEHESSDEDESRPSSTRRPTMTLSRPLVHHRRPLLGRLLRPRRVRLRRRHAALVRRPRPTPSAASPSTPSARSGTATRCG